MPVQPEIDENWDLNELQSLIFKSPAQPTPKSKTRTANLQEDTPAKLPPPGPIKDDEMQALCDDGDLFGASLPPSELANVFNRPAASESLQPNDLEEPNKNNKKKPRNQKPRPEAMV